METAYSLSLVYRYCAVLHHNLREYTPENVDPELTRYNVILLRPEGDPEEIFNRFFEEAVSDYNRRKLLGIREDGSIGRVRREKVIDNYFRKVSEGRDKTHPFVEMVVQVGSRDDNSSLNRESRIYLASQEIYRSYFQEFSTRFPSLHLVSAVIHNDEPMGTPHMHLDLIPAVECEKGLRLRCSFSGAVGQTAKMNPSGEIIRQGRFGSEGEGELYERGTDGIRAWKSDQRRLLIEICRNYGVRIREPISEHRHSLMVEEYKASQARIAPRLRDIQKEQERVEKELQGLLLEREALKLWERQERTGAVSEEEEISGRMHSGRKAEKTKETERKVLTELKKDQDRKIQWLLDFYKKNPEYGRRARLLFERSCLPDGCDISAFRRSPEEIRKLLPDELFREIVWERTWAIRPDDPLRDPHLPDDPDFVLSSVKSLHGASGPMETSRGRMEVRVVPGGFRIQAGALENAGTVVIYPFGLASEVIMRCRREMIEEWNHQRERTIERTESMSRRH